MSYQGVQPNVLRTIYLPNNDASGMAEEVNNLHRKIAENRVTFEHILMELRAKKSAKEEDARGVFIKQVE